MLSNIVPDWGVEGTPPVPEVAPLAFALERMRPDLLVPGALPGETLADVRTRRAAALDILDDLLAEYAAGRVEGVDR